MHARESRSLTGFLLGVFVSPAALAPVSCEPVVRVLPALLRALTMALKGRHKAFDALLFASERVYAAACAAHLGTQRRDPAVNSTLLPQ